MTAEDLLVRIMAFQIDDGPAAFPFAVRLAQENRWSQAYAQRVVDEYKRFVYLMAAAGHPVTPSDQVDQAWHLHLSYTRSYWERLCGQVVGKPLHHNPTQGGDAEDAKFGDWYARTLETYERVFGAPPPGDIWPDSATRFGIDPRAVRVNTVRSWIIEKRPVRRAAAGGAAAIAGAAALAGCTAMLGAGIDPLLLVFILIFAVAVIFIISRAKGGGGWGGGCGSSGCSSSGGSSGCGGSGCGSGCGGGGCGGGGD